ncbi:MAG: fatty acid metabolism transcriptional regulator FadR [Desulfosudaceae bacterium]
MYQPDKPLFKPAQYAEETLITAILDGTYPPGQALPSERALAEKIGVTRPTIREVLHRLAKDRWITIHHGRPTRVNDYWRRGGMGILSTLARHPAYLPDSFVINLLEIRAVFMPACAEAALPGHEEEFLTCLARAADMPATAAAYAEFDWQLQERMARLSGNLIYPLIVNDFTPVFQALGEGYFSLPEGRRASAAYYRRLTRAITAQGDVAGVVRRAMEESIHIWKTFQQDTNGTKP